MTSYCTLADVEGRLRGPALTTSSTPTSDEARDMIEDIASEMDSALASNGVTVPVTTPAAFVRWLAKVNQDGAAATILTARFADDRGVNSNTAAARYERRYQAALARLWDGTGIPSTLGLGDAVLPTSYSVEYPDDEPDLGDIQTTSFGDDWEL